MESMPTPGPPPPPPPPRRTPGGHYGRPSTPRFDEGLPKWLVWSVSGVAVILVAVLAFGAKSESKKVAYDDRGLAYLYQEWYVKRNRPLRSNHPRDIIEQILDVSAYLGLEPALNKELVDRACDSYFVEL